MNNLIQSLAIAHADLLSASERPNADPGLASTARKVEGTLVKLLQALPAEGLEEAVIPALNSGSLKVLKLIPEGAKLPSPRFGREPLSSDFILARPASYLREALKRGFTLSMQERLKALKEAAQSSDRHNRLQAEARVLSGSFSADFMVRTLRLVMELTEAEARNVAGVVERILKACIKADPDRFQIAFDRMLGIHDPGAAHEHLFRYIAIYAMLGAKKPAAGIFENAEMKRLASSVATGAGRKELQAQTGGLEAFLIKGHRAPTGIIAEFERKRLGWRRPRH